MTEGAVAERYARAIFELAVESGSFANSITQFQRFAEQYSLSKDLRSVLDNPLVDAPARERILRDVAARLGVSGHALNAVRLLMSRHRLVFLPEIARRLSSLSDERAGVLQARVRTAKALSESFYQRLQRELEAVTQRKVNLVRELDPSLVAGVVTQLGGMTIDGSVRGRLAEIQKQLLSQ